MNQQQHFSHLYDLDIVQRQYKGIAFRYTVKISVPLIVYQEMIFRD